MKRIILLLAALPLLFACAQKETAVSLADFGGVPDGITLNTEAFAKAMDAVSSKGGGILNVPSGIWLTGPITLKSGVNLHLERGAVVVFDPDLDLYPVLDANFEGVTTKRCLAPLNATGQKNIAITGEGIFDGNGQAWRALKKSKASETLWKRYLAMGGYVAEDGNTWYPDKGFAKANATADFNKPDPSLDENEIKRFFRPELVLIRECEGVLLEGCTFENSPAWNIHLLWSKDIEVRNITVRNPSYSQNGDGIDIDACDGVHLQGCSFDVGDDAICLKSGKDKEGRDKGLQSKNMLIEDCTVYAGHGGFVIGSEMSGGVSNIKVRNCTFIGTDVGLRFKSTRGRGGVVSDIDIKNICMKDIIGDAVIFNLYYAGKAATDIDKDGNPVVAAMPVDETTPEFRDIRIKNVTCNSAGGAIYINGLPEMPVKNVSFTDCIFRAVRGIEMYYTENVTQENVKFIQQ